MTKTYYIQFLDFGYVVHTEYQRSAKDQFKDIKDDLCQFLRYQMDEANKVARNITVSITIEKNTEGPFNVDEI
jgi:hypothetical protein